MVRAFIAIPCPADVKEEITGIQKEIKTLGDLKLVEPDNIHLTLRFLGEIDAGTIDKISERLDSLSETGGFEISLKGLGVFPKPSYARVIWVGVENGAERIEELHGKIESELKTLGFSGEKEFSSHFTIARVKSIDKSKLIEILNKNSKREFGSFPADRIELMKSELTPMGPRYSLLHDTYLR